MVGGCGGRITVRFHSACLVGDRLKSTRHLYRPAAYNTFQHIILYQLLIVDC